MAQVERSYGEEARGLGLDRQIIAGIIGGLAGGVVFGMMMAMMGMLPIIASMVGSQSAVIGFIIHMMISAGIGAGFGLVLGRSATTLGVAVGLGALYGGVWWILGPLTIMPIMMGMGPQWSVAAAVGSLASLMGHVIYGGIAGAVYGLLAPRA